MNFPEFFPNELIERYLVLEKKFEKIRPTWQKNNDEIIPQDSKFAQEIIQFLIDSLEFVQKNTMILDMDAIRDFFGYIDLEFYYGPDLDNRSYLDFDETVDGEGLAEFFHDLKDDDFKLTPQKVIELKGKCEKLLQEF
jgi:hypothetical protein